MATYRCSNRTCRAMFDASPTGPCPKCGTNAFDLDLPGATARGGGANITWTWIEEYWHVHPRWLALNVAAVAVGKAVGLGAAGVEGMLLTLPLDVAMFFLPPWRERRKRQRVGGRG